MGQLEKSSRVSEVQEAWHLYTEGVSKREIARRMSRDPRTVSNYVTEASEWYQGDTRETKRVALVASHRRILEKAWQMIESGDIKPTSLAGPQYLMRATDSLKEIARLEGLNQSKSEVEHTVINLAELAKEAARRGKDEASEE